MSSLLQVQSRTWQAEYTSDLIDLLNVLGLLEELEPREAELLDAVLTWPLVNGQDLPTVTAQFARVRRKVVSAGHEEFEGWDADLGWPGAGVGCS